MPSKRRGTSALAHALKGVLKSSKNLRVFQVGHVTDGNHAASFRSKAVKQLTEAGTEPDESVPPKRGSAESASKEKPRYKLRLSLNLTPNGCSRYEGKGRVRGHNSTGAPNLVEQTVARPDREGHGANP